LWLVAAVIVSVFLILWPQHIIDVVPPECFGLLGHPVPCGPSAAPVASAFAGGGAWVLTRRLAWTSTVFIGALALATGVLATLVSWTSYGLGEACYGTLSHRVPCATWTKILIGAAAGAGTWMYAFRRANRDVERLP
jgi:hypothetical protein